MFQSYGQPQCACLTLSADIKNIDVKIIPFYTFYLNKKYLAQKSRINLYVFQSMSEDDSKALIQIRVLTTALYFSSVSGFLWHNS